MKFGEKVRMELEFAQINFELAVSFIIIALLLCFVGIKFFRIIAGTMAFLLTAIFFIVVMKHANPGYVVTTFTIIGLAICFITFKWYRLSAFVIAALLSYSFSALIFNAIWINIVIGLLLALIVNLYPIITIITLTSLWGGLYTAIEGFNLLGINLPGYLTIVLGLLLAAAGAFSQYSIEKEILNLPVKDRRMKVFQ